MLKVAGGFAAFSFELLCITKRGRLHKIIQLRLVSWVQDAHWYLEIFYAWTAALFFSQTRLTRESKSLQICSDATVESRYRCNYLLACVPINLFDSPTCLTDRKLHRASDKALQSRRSQWSLVARGLRVMSQACLYQKIEMLLLESGQKSSRRGWTSSLCRFLATRGCL